MKKMILCSALTIAITGSVQAEEPPPTATQPAATVDTVPAPNTNAPATPIPGPSDVTQAGNDTPPQPTEAINCHYKPTKSTTIEQPMLITWTKNAIQQIFTMNPAQLDTQMLNIQNCFTAEGWQGYRDALQKSGNMDAIKTQKLMVTNQVQSDPVFVDVKENLWELTTPVRVIYQSETGPITQELTITTRIGRKPNGEYGILQIVAVPKEQPKPSVPGAPTPDNNIPAKTE